MTSKKSPLSRSSTKILDVMYANPFFAPLLFLKTVPLVTPKSGDNSPKRERICAGDIYIAISTVS